MPSQETAEASSAIQPMHHSMQHRLQREQSSQVQLCCLEHEQQQTFRHCMEIILKYPFAFSIITYRDSKVLLQLSTQLRWALS